jgi:hypothetical protein
MDLEQKGLLLISNLKERTIMSQGCIHSSKILKNYKIMHEIHEHHARTDVCHSRRGSKEEVTIIHHALQQNLLLLYLIGRHCLHITGQ